MESVMESSSCDLNLNDHVYTSDRPLQPELEAAHEELLGEPSDVRALLQDRPPRRRQRGDLVPRWSDEELIYLLQQFHDLDHGCRKDSRKERAAQIFIPGRNPSSIYQKLKKMAYRVSDDAIDPKELAYIDRYTTRRLLCKTFVIPPKALDHEVAHRKRLRREVYHHCEDEPDSTVKKVSLLSAQRDEDISSPIDVRTFMSYNPPTASGTDKSQNFVHTVVRPVARPPISIDLTPTSPLTSGSTLTSIPRPPLTLPLFIRPAPSSTSLSLNSSASVPDSPSSTASFPYSHASSNVSASTTSTTFLPYSNPSSHTLGTTTLPSGANIGLSPDYLMLDSQKGELLLRRYRAAEVIMGVKSAMLEASLSMNTVANLSSTGSEARFILHNSMKNLAHHMQLISTAVEHRLLGPF